MCLAAVQEGVLLNKEFAPIWKHPALVGKSGAKGRLEMAKVSMSWRVLCRHSLERRNLVQTLLKALDRLFRAVASERTAKPHRPQLYFEPKWLR